MIIRRLRLVKTETQTPNPNPNPNHADPPINPIPRNSSESGNASSVYSRTQLPGIWDRRYHQKPLPQDHVCQRLDLCPSRMRQLWKWGLPHFDIIASNDAGISFHQLRMFKRT